MQIHELNAFNGTPGSSDYLAIDNGTDTSKISASGLVAPFDTRISGLENEVDVLDERVDQIVAPSGEAPSAAEVTDARIGANGVTYGSLGTAIRTQVSDLKSDLIKTTDVYCITKPPGSLGLFSFNPTAGSLSSDNTRLTLTEGISLRGAKFVDIEISNGYEWNIYFTDEISSYSLILQYSNVWIDKSISFIPVPENANRLHISCKKSDGTAFNSSELANVFEVKLLKTKEQDLYDYSESTDLYTNYYGHYQYAASSPSVGQWNRLTQERFYEIGDYDIIVFSPNTGYKAVINFFDAEFNRLGNNGGWITGKTLLLLTSYYNNTKYFKITYCRTDSANMNEDDFNQFTIHYFTLTQVAPLLNKKQLKFIELYDDTSSDVAVYNGHIVVADTNKIWIDGTEISATVGHGNNIQFGTALDGTFPRLYAGSWYQGEQKVYVNKITVSSATLLNTIEYTELPTGFLNMCVDEANERIYIFMETGADTYAGNILFAIGDFNGNIISSKSLDVSIPVIQGMEYKDGFIYVASGNGTNAYPNYIRCFDVSGNLLSQSFIDGYSELEGMSIDTDCTIYIKMLRLLFKITA